MVAIARGLMSRPKLLLLDDPSLGLAPLLVASVFAAIREIKERGTTSSWLNRTPSRRWR